MPDYSSKELPELLLGLGNPGKYQTLLALLLWCGTPLVAMNHLIMGIYGAAPEHSCRLPNGIAKAQGIPYRVRDGIRRYSSCTIFKDYNATAGITTPCTSGWNYDYSAGGKTIVSEWNLVCERQYMVSLATSLYFAGVMIGGLVFGMIADKFGRRFVYLSTLYGHLLVGIVVSQLPSYIPFVICRIIVGFLLQGLQSTGFILLIETISAPHRTNFGVIYTAFWGVGSLWVSLISFTLRDWRSIQLALCLPSIVTVFYYWIVPESLRWLLVHGRYEEMAAIVRRIASHNNIDLSTNARALVQQISFKQDTKRMGIVELMKSRTLRTRTLVMCIIWMATSIGYYGLALNATRLKGNRYLNFLINGCVELPAGVSCIWVLRRFGRKRTIQTYLWCAGVMCITSGLIPRGSGSSNTLDVTASMFALIGKFFASATFTSIIVMGAELFPTVVRNSGVGCCFFAARLGGILAPQILLLGHYTFSQLPILILGGTQILGGLMVMFLPETRDQIILDTMKDLKLIVNKEKQDLLSCAEENADETLTKNVE